MPGLSHVSGLNLGQGLNWRQGLGGAGLAAGGTFDPLSLSPFIWLKLDEGSGTTPADSSGNGNDAAFINTPEWDAGPPVSLSFVSADSDGLLVSGLLGSPPAVTLCAWVSSLTPGDQPEIISIGNAAELRLDSLGIRIAWFDGSFQATTSNDGSLNGQGWHHIAGVIDPANARQEGYIDGISVAQSAFSTAINYAGTGVVDTYLGQIVGTALYDGLIRQAVVFPSALTTQQIAAVMAATM